MQALNDFILNIAPYHFGTPDAPNTWEGLQAVKDMSPMPVFDGNCENTIFESKTVNLAARAWHDSVHLKHDLSFSLQDEIRVARIQCAQLIDAGLSSFTHLIWLDVVGQILYYDKHKQYVPNQKAFVDYLMLNGFGFGSTDSIKAIL